MGDDGRVSGWKSDGSITLLFALSAYFLSLAVHERTWKLLPLQAVNLAHEPNDSRASTTPP